MVLRHRETFTRREFRARHESKIYPRTTRLSSESSKIRFLLRAELSLWENGHDKFSAHENIGGSPVESLDEIARAASSHLGQTAGKTVPFPHFLGLAIL